MGLRRTRVVDNSVPATPKGASAPAPAKNPPAKQGAADNERIRRYREVVAANKAAGRPLSDGSAYRALTRSDCAQLWNPDCPEASDPARRP